MSQKIKDNATLADCFGFSCNDAENGKEIVIVSTFPLKNYKFDESITLLVVKNMKKMRKMGLVRISNQYFALCNCQFAL